MKTSLLFNLSARSVIVSNVSACMAPSANRLGLIMTKNSRVNHERGFSMKRGSAEKSIREGNSVWIIKGVSIRDATVAEMFDVMSMTADERAALAEEDKKLGHREISGLIFEPSDSGIPATRREKFLAWQARYFVKNGAMPDLRAHDFAMSATA